MLFRLPSFFPMIHATLIFGEAPPPTCSLIYRTAPHASRGAIQCFFSRSLPTTMNGQKHTLCCEVIFWFIAVRRTRVLPVHLHHFPGSVVRVYCKAVLSRSLVITESRKSCTMQAQPSEKVSTPFCSAGGSRQCEHVGNAAVSSCIGEELDVWGGACHCDFAVRVAESLTMVVCRSS